MAYETGTATDYLDLHAKVRDFLTTNAALVAAGQEWEVVGGVASGALVNGDFTSFKAPGLIGTDEIYMSIESYNNTGANTYNLRLRGHTFYDPSSPSPNPAGSSKPVDFLLGNTALSYWIVANGRRFVLVAKFNSAYEWMYGGFMLPYHLPDDWAYPLLIGGSADDAGRNASDNSNGHSAFWHPATAGTSAAPDQTSQCYLFAPSNAWRPIRNRWGLASTNTLRGCQTAQYTNNFNGRFRRALDDSACVELVEITQIGDSYTGDVIPAAPDGGCNYGTMDGVYYTSAFGATPEQEVTIGSKNFMLFPNIRRVSDLNFAALCLE